MSKDLPSDVVAVITQLCAETRRAIAKGEYDTARAAVGTMNRVATNKLSDGDERRTVRHACERVTDLLADDPQQDVATAYVEALERQFPTDS